MNTFSLPSAFIPFNYAVHRRNVCLPTAFPLAAPAVKVFAAATPAVKVFAAATPAKASEEKAKRPPRGITKPKLVSPALEAVVGVKEIPRTQALKVIWAYIKEHNLQDPDNKKIIVCDEKLKAVFAGKERVGFLEISGLLNPHFAK